MAKQIGCSKCRQDDDIGYIFSQKTYDAGWVGEVESTFELSNWPVAMNTDYEYEDNDIAEIYFSLWVVSRKERDEPLFCERHEIKYCPFCGANLKKVRDYMRSLISEEER